RVPDAGIPGGPGDAPECSEAQRGGDRDDEDELAPVALELRLRVEELPKAHEMRVSGGLRRQTTSMESCVLLKYGEMVLRGRNRHRFYEQLQRNMRRALR